MTSKQLPAIQSQWRALDCPAPLSRWAWLSVGVSLCLYTAYIFKIMINFNFFNFLGLGG